MTGEQTIRGRAFHAIPADRLPWRACMVAVLGILATETGSRTVAQLLARTVFCERSVRASLGILVAKGTVHRTPGRPAVYRIAEHGRRLVDRDPRRFRC